MPPTLSIRMRVSSPGGELGGGKCSSEPSIVFASFLSSSGAPPSTMRAVPVIAR